jgi:hypothetical protein
MPNSSLLFEAIRYPIAPEVILLVAVKISLKGTAIIFLMKRTSTRKIRELAIKRAVK